MAISQVPTAALQYDHTYLLSCTVPVYDTCNTVGSALSGMLTERFLTVGTHPRSTSPLTCQPLRTGGFIS